MSVGAKVRLSIRVKRSGHGDWWILNATPQMCAAIFPWAKTDLRCVCETEFVPDFLSSSSSLFALLSSLRAGWRELWCGTLSVLWPQAQEEPDALWTGLWCRGIYINKKERERRWVHGYRGAAFMPGEFTVKFPASKQAEEGVFEG